MWYVFPGKHSPESVKLSGPLCAIGAAMSDLDLFQLVVLKLVECELRDYIQYIC